MLGHNNYKRLFGFHLDTHQEYTLKDTTEDHALLIDLSSAMQKISKRCMELCINIENSDFSKNEEKCVNQCVIYQHQAIMNLTKKYEEKMLLKKQEPLFRTLNKD